MSEVKSTIIVPIAFYCFFLGVYFLSLAVNAILGNKAGLASTDFGLWLIVLIFIILMAGIVAVGLGILYLNQSCWKILFFFLVSCVSCIASYIVVFLIFLLIDVRILTPCYQIIQHASGGWFAFLSFFISEIIILYYLANNEVVSSF